MIVGGIASRVASEVLNGRATKLRDLTAPLVEYVLAFYRLGEPGPKEGKLGRLRARAARGGRARRGAAQASQRLAPRITRTRLERLVIWELMGFREQKPCPVSPCKSRICFSNTMCVS